jgi:hypothetical protein
MKHTWRNLVFPLLALVLAACTGGGTPPSISNFDPLTLEISGKTNELLSGQFSFKNTGGSDLIYSSTVAAGGEWLKISEGASGTVKPNSTQTIKASAQCPAMPANLSTTIKVTVMGISESKDLVVNLKCLAPDTTPDAFSLAPVTNAEPNTDITSAQVTITGIDAPTPVSVDVGTVLVNGVAASTINNNDKLSVRLKSSAAFNTAVSSKVNVGGVMGTFTVTTKVEPKLTLSLDPLVLTLKRGESKTSVASITRDGFSGDVTVATTTTNGVAAETVVIPPTSSSNSATLTIRAAADATIGQFDVPVSASGGGKTATASIKVTVVGSSPTPLTSGGYQNIVAVVGKPIAAQIPTIMGGTTPYLVSINSALPAGLALDTATGGLSGTPSAVATLKTYTITMQDSSTPAQSLTKTIDITVNPALAFKSGYSNVNGTIGFEIKKPGMALVEGGIPPYSYSIAPALPAGIAIDAATGKISGKPTVLSAPASHTVTVKDSDGTTVTTPVKVSVSPVPVFTKGYQSLINEVTDPEKLPQTPEVSGGALPLSFTITPDITAKTGMRMDAATGVLSGTPTKPVLEEKYTVVASDENGVSTETSFRVLILPRFAPKVTDTSVKAGEIVNTDLKNIKVNFNKNVNATSDSMTLVCDGETIAFDGLPIVKSSTTTLLLKTTLQQDTVCVLTVLKNKVADLLDPPLNMEADFVLSFKTDAAPDVTAFEVIPDGGATANERVGTDINIKIDFTEPVDVVAGGMTLVCGVTNIVFTGLPISNKSSVVVDPVNDLPQDATCTLTVLKDKVSDTDTADLPDNMNENRVFTVKTDIAPDASGIETTVSSDETQPDRVAVTSDIKINFSEAVSVTAAGMTLVCDNVSVPFSGLPSGDSTSATLDPTDELPQDATCVLTVLKAGVSDTDTADLPDNMNQNRVFTFKTEALFGFIDLKLAFDPPLLSHEDGSDVDPNVRKLGQVRLQNVARGYDQTFGANEVIQVPNGNFIVAYIDGTDTPGNAYPGIGLSSLVVAPKGTTALNVSFKDPTVVRNISDAAPDSLRDVVGKAQTNTVVTFLDSLFNVPPRDTITLSGQINVTKNITIYGQGLSKIFVNADGSNSRVFAVGTAGATIRSLTIISGTAPAEDNGNSHVGGCILSNGNLTLAKLWIADCRADAHGGGVAVLPLTGNFLLKPTLLTPLVDVGLTLTISDSFIYGSSAGQFGGGIYSRANSVITGSFIGGTGFGFSNSTLQKGAGAYFDGTTTISQTEFAGNRVGNGLPTTAQPPIQAQEAALGDGGGFYSQGPLTMTGGTLFDNLAAREGGGAYIYGGEDNIIFEDVSVYGNDARIAGGGIRFDGAKLKINNSRLGKLAGMNESPTRLGNSTSRFVSYRVASAIAPQSISAQNGFSEGGGALNISYSSEILDPVIEITNSKLEANVAYYGNGGAVVAGKKIGFKNSELNYNTAFSAGGAIYYLSNSKNPSNDLVTIDNTKLTHNCAGTTDVYNPAVCLDPSINSEGITQPQPQATRVTAQIQDDCFGNINNTGGAISIFLARLLVKNQSVLQDNASYNSGGAIYACTPTLAGPTVDPWVQILNSEVLGNQSKVDGGGVYVASDGFAMPSNLQPPQPQGVRSHHAPVAPTQRVTGQNKVAQIAPQAIRSQANSGTFGLWVDQSKINGNKTSLNGGGIYTQTDTTIKNTQFDGNQANLNDEGFEGGGAHLQGIVVATDNRVTDNISDQGGGFNIETFPQQQAANTETIIARNIFSGNTGTSYDGGIDIHAYNSGPAVLTLLSIENNKIDSNTAGIEEGGVHISSSVNTRIFGNTVSNNTAVNSYGGIRIDQSDNNLQFVNNTISGNLAPCNSGIYVFSDNSVDFIGKFNTAFGNVNSEDECDKDGFPVYMQIQGGYSITGNLITNNSLPQFGTNLNFANIDDNYLEDTTPTLGPLANNGGTVLLPDGLPTFTHLPAANAITLLSQTNCDSTTTTTDQRGQPRPNLGSNTSCDFGAVEVQNTEVIAPPN